MNVVSAAMIGTLRVKHFLHDVALKGNLDFKVLDTPQWGLNSDMRLIASFLMGEKYLLPKRINSCESSPAWRRDSLTKKAITCTVLLPFLKWSYRWR